jgi:hypothetical protein
MHTHHQIPHWRLERDYLLSIARGCGLATYQLRMINAKPVEKPIIFIRTILGNLRRVLGLAIAYQIVVEKHGGELLCFSKPGEGTEVIEIAFNRGEALGLNGNEKGNKQEKRKSVNVFFIISRF